MNQLSPLPPSLSVPSKRRLLASRRRQVVAISAVLVAVGFLIYQGLQNATIYFLTANQAVAQKTSLGTSQFRLEGTVKPGVIQKGNVVDFSVFANGVSVPVVSSGSPPQLFRVGIPVVLEGHWSGNYYSSDQIMVKHTASYVEAHPNRLKSQLPSTTVS